MNAAGLRVVRVTVVAVATAAASVAAAQSTNVLPDLSTGDAAFDPARAAGLPAEAKAAFAAAAAKLQERRPRGA